MKLLTILALFAFAFVIGCDDDQSTKATQDQVQQLITPATTHPAVDGIALAVVVDCSGSMADRVSDGIKIDLAHNSVHKIFTLAETFAKARSTPVKIALYSFSDAPQRVWPSFQSFADPSAAGAAQAIDSLIPTGGTAIGNAVITATKDLNESGYTNINILVVTDGENNSGTSPDDVSAAFSKLPAAQRPKVFVVAFDTSASIFDNVKKNGWKVLSASNGAELDSTLNTLVGGEILLEK